ncbi:MAG TPA: DivIVA domain-containing protein [Candidatus Cloacimonadota bacterium]|nr:DivIVA domain-containing protein [Candidatus Cloacimonadota bacterium]
MNEKFDLTPVEIRHKDFSSSLFGFNKNEVRDYLEMLSTQIEDLISQKSDSNDPYKNNIFDDRSQSALVLEQLQKKEELISKTLIQAENTKNDIIRNANKEAENIIRSAELAAKKAIDDTKQYINALQHHFVNLKESKRQFLMETHAQIKTFIQRIEQDPLMNSARESEMDTQFNQASSIKTEI